MTYLLDSSIIINLLRRKGTIAEFIKQHIEDTFITSSVCQAEIYVGLYQEKPDNFLKRKKQIDSLFASFSEIASFDSSEARIFGKIKTELNKKGTTIDDLDIQIAATTLSNNAILITANTKHFSRISNLNILSLE